MSHQLKQVFVFKIKRVFKAPTFRKQYQFLHKFC